MDMPVFTEPELAIKVRILPRCGPMQVVQANPNPTPATGLSSDLGTKRVTYGRRWTRDWSRKHNI